MVGGERDSRGGSRYHQLIRLKTLLTAVDCRFSLYHGELSGGKAGRRRAEEVLSGFGEITADITLVTHRTHVFQSIYSGEKIDKKLCMM